MDEVTVPTKAGAANTIIHTLLMVSSAYNVVLTFGSSPGKAGHIAREIPTETGLALVRKIAGNSHGLGAAPGKSREMRTD